MRQHAVVIAIVLSLTGCGTIRADQLRTGQPAIAAAWFERGPPDSHSSGR